MAQPATAMDGGHGERNVHRSGRRLMREFKTISFAALLAIAGTLAPARCAPSILPDPVLTPAAVRTADPADVRGDRSTQQYRHWSRARDDRILAEYGHPPGPHPNYEVDHLIPLDLGGADGDVNLWPEPVVGQFE
jgi:hypothetical protein